MNEQRTSSDVGGEDGGVPTILRSDGRGSRGEHGADNGEKCELELHCDRASSCQKVRECWLMLYVDVALPFYLEPLHPQDRWMSALATHDSAAKVNIETQDVLIQLLCGPRNRYLISPAPIASRYVIHPPIPLNVPPECVQQISEMWRFSNQLT